ncbi:hypothetical protein [Angustibacter peucedani]
MSAAREPVGTAADEAARLVEAVSGWWAGQQAAPGPDEPTTHEHHADHADHARAAGEPETAGQPSVCRYCPWCRALAAAQQVRPEVVEHLLGAAEQFAAALRELSHDLAARGAAGPPTPGAHDPSSRDADHPAPRAGAARTVTIPVEPDEDEQDDVRDQVREDG